MTYDDDVIHAVTREQFANREGYQPPAEVVAAQKALGDLAERTKDRPRTRDEKRLASRYAATVNDHHAALVAKWGPRPASPEAAVDAIEARIAAASDITD